MIIKAIRDSTAQRDNSYQHERKCQRNRRAHQSDDNELFRKLKAGGLETALCNERAAVIGSNFTSTPSGRLLQLFQFGLHAVMGFTSVFPATHVTTRQPPSPSPSNSAIPGASPSNWNMRDLAKCFGVQ